MNITIHGKMRLRQRGFSVDLLNIMELHGYFEEAPGGAERLSFGRKEANMLRQQVEQEYKECVRQIERCVGRMVIIKDNYIITAYRRD
jgi:hypothetical protein